jgi:uncharacterized protein DUF4388
MSVETLHGDLKHFFPAEILQLLSLAQANGRLELQRPSERAEIFVERGQPVFARTDGASVKVGELLVHRGAVSAETIEGVLKSPPQQPGARLGARLVAAGVATPDQVQNAVRERLRRVLYGLLLWREGTFRFVAGEQAEGEDIHLDLDLDRLILEGLRQADETRRAS